MKENKIKEQIKTEITGAEKNKLFPTDIGMVVNDFLLANFPFSSVRFFSFMVLSDLKINKIQKKIRLTPILIRFNPKGPA